MYDKIALHRQFVKFSRVVVAQFLATFPVFLSNLLTSFDTVGIALPINFLVAQIASNCSKVTTAYKIFVSRFLSEWFFNNPRSFLFCEIFREQRGARGREPSDNEAPDLNAEISSRGEERSDELSRAPRAETSKRTEGEPNGEPR